MSCRRVNVEEVWERQDGTYTGLSSGREYSKDEVEHVGTGCWTIPNHGVDNWELDNAKEENVQDTAEYKSIEKHNQGKGSDNRFKQ